MALSKRLRYEILRRDNHACRYCGATAPDIVLTVDHVNPTALGGTDEPANLVAACADCNAGKSSSTPDAPVVEDVAQDALRWSRARLVASELAFQTRRDRRINVESILEYWSDTFRGTFGEIPPYDQHDAEQSIARWYEQGLTTRDIYELVDVVEGKAIAKKIAWASLWRYFAGCCTTRVRELDAVTQALLTRGDI